MKRLSILACVVLLLLKLKGCSANCTTTLIIPASKYSGRSAAPGVLGGQPSLSEVASLLLPPANSEFPPPAPPSPSLDVVSSIDSLSTSPYLLSCVPPSMVLGLVVQLSSRPSLLLCAGPRTVASLIGVLSVSPSLLKLEPGAVALADLAAAIVLSPEMADAVLSPSAVVRLLVKIRSEAAPRPTDALCSLLSPAVRVRLLRTACSDADALEPAEITFLVDLLAASPALLADAPPSALAAVLQAVASRTALAANGASVRLLHAVSQLAPALLSAVVAPDVARALLTPAAVSAARGQSSDDALAQLTAVVVSSPSLLCSAGFGDAASALLEALSRSATSSAAIVQLLTEIALSGRKLLAEIKSDAIVGALDAIVASASPGLIGELPAFVRFALVTRLAEAPVTAGDPLSVRTLVKFVETLAAAPALVAQLSPDSIGRLICCVVSDDALLHAVPPDTVVRFVYAVTTTMSSCALRRTPPDRLRTLLSPLESSSALASLDPGCYSKLLSTAARCPPLLHAFSDVQLGNVLTTLLDASPDVVREIPADVCADLLTQIFATPALLTKVPMDVLLDLMPIVQCRTPNATAIPCFAISEFADSLGREPSVLATLSPALVLRLVAVLNEVPRVTAQLSVEALDALFMTVTTSSAVSYAMPVEAKIRLLRAVCSVAPSLFGSLSPVPIRGIVNSFGSFESLSRLNAQCLTELTAVLSECPMLVASLDGRVVTNLFDVLSASPAALSALDGRAIVDLVVSVSAVAPVPPATYLRFLRTLSAAAPTCSVPTSATAVLLANVTAKDAEILVDAMIAAPRLVADLPRTALIAAVAANTAVVPVSRVKIVTLLATIHSVAPSLMCTVPEDVLAAALVALVLPAARPEGLPAACVAALATLLSSSPCLLDSMPAAACHTFLGLLSASPAVLRQQLSARVLADLLAKLSLTPGHVIGLPLLVSLLSAAGPSATCTLSPALARALLLSAGCDDARTVYKLPSTDLASLLSVVSGAPRLLDAMPARAFDTLMCRMASSPRLLTRLSPSLIASFLAAVARSPTALRCVQPVTLVGALDALAARQPAVLSAVPQSALTAVLAAFDDPPAFASLPPPVVADFARLLLSSPPLFTALSLSTLDRFLRFLAATPTVLGSLPAATAARLLAIVSSLPRLLAALSPTTLVAFIAALSAASPQFLCSLPPTAGVGPLMVTVASGPALATYGPDTVSALITTLNRSPCLIAALPAPALVSLISHLSCRPRLLDTTPKSELVAFVDNVRSPRGFGSPAPRLRDRSNDPSPLCVAALPAESKPVTPQLVAPDDGAVAAGPKVFACFGDGDGPDTRQIPKLILPKNANRASVYVYPKKPTKIDVPCDE